jgi:hypothetical protein
MDSLKAAGDGSYVYRKKKNMLDQILVSASLLESRGAFVGRSGCIARYDWMTALNDKKESVGPLHTYKGTLYIGGYSDHYPVYANVYFA